MIIAYQGLESFRISHGDLVLAFNPISKDSKLKAKSFGADVTLITTNHPDTNGAEQTSRGEKKSFVINGPGEYEVKDIFIKGFLSESRYGLPAQADGNPKGQAYGARKLNTVYLASFEGMNLCFLGALSNAELSTEVLEALENIGILFLPVGGGEVLSPADAYKLAVSLEPAIIIPMHYTDASLKQFLKEGGEDKIEPLDKLVIKKKDLEDKNGDIVVLKQE